MKKKHVYIRAIRCPDCGYCNQLENVAKYGTCLLCHKIIDSKCYFKAKLNDKLGLWRNNRNMRRF